MLKLENIKKIYDGKEILHNISFDVNDAEIVSILGSSGSGKTTLLMCLCGLLPFESGTIKLNSLTINKDTYTNEMEKIWGLRKETGVVFQHLYLFPHLTALGNIIEAPIHVLKRTREEAEAEAMDLLAKVGLADSADKFPEELSGGEQQRVAICRALAMKPKVLFLDEPTSALDPQRSADIRNLLNDFVKQGSTLVIVSHSLNFLKGLADIIAYMEAGEVVECDSTEEVIKNPKDKRTKYFLEHF